MFQGKRAALFAGACASAVLVTAGAASAAPVADVATDPAAPVATDTTPTEAPPAADEEVTVTATRTPARVVDVPVVVSVISAERIADEQATDIKDLIRYEPGISVTRQPARFGAALGTAGRAGDEGFTIRGIGGNRVLIQVDGIRVPDGFAFGAQSVGRGDYVDVGMVKSVEILRGPASALYGSDGLAGAVSFITSDPEDFLKNGRDVAGLARAAWSSADNEFSETAVLAGRSGAWSLMGAYTRRDFKELENRGDNKALGALRTAPNPQDGQSNAAMGRVVYAPGNGHRFRLTGEYLDDRLSSDILSGRSVAVNSVVGRDTGQRIRGSADWSYTGDGTLEFARFGAYWQQSKRRQFTAEDRATLVDRTRINTFDNRVYGAAAEVRGRFDTGAVGHRIVTGGDISMTRQQGLRDGTVPPIGESFPTRAFPKTDYMLAGVFVSDEIKLGPVSLFPALRFDAYDLDPTDDPLLPAFRGAKQDGSRLSPKLGAIVEVGEGARLFANYARGFKAPEPSQVNQAFQNLGQNYTSIPNPNLRPEKSASVEGGFRVFNPAVSLEVTAFHAKYDDFISQELISGNYTVANPAVFQFINLAEVKVNGAEARFTARAASGVNGSLGLSYAKGDTKREASLTAAASELPLSTVDPVKLVVGVGFDDPGKRFGARVIMTHSAGKDPSRTTGACGTTVTGALTPCFTPDAFTILDATAWVRLTEGLTLRAGLFNLTDEKYAWWSDVRGLSNASLVKDAFTQPGRNGSVSLSYRF